jgi:hypothetical protein
MYQRNCRNCGRIFNAKRSDAVYCSERCTAQWDREHPFKQHEHVWKDETIYENCQQCGKGFTFNDYANRGGKRQPQYCSTKCRQKAYRERQKIRNAPPKQNTKTKSTPPPPPKKTIRDPYVILGVTYQSTKAEIRKAYMKLIKFWHPDINASPEATEKAQDINWAYDKLNK